MHQSRNSAVFVEKRMEKTIFVGHSHAESDTNFEHGAFFRMYFRSQTGVN